MKEYKKPASLNVARSRLESAKGGSTGFAEGFSAGVSSFGFKGGYDYRVNTPVKQITVVRSN